MLYSLENRWILANRAPFQAICAGWPCLLALFYAILAMCTVRLRSNQLTLTLRALQSIQPRRDLVWLLLFWRLCDVVSSSRKPCNACSCGVEEFLAEARLSDLAAVEAVMSDCTLPYV